MSRILLFILIVFLTPGVLFPSPPITEKLESKNRPLYYAARNGRIKELKKFLRHGVDINTPGLLYAAAEAGQLEIVRLLLDKGARINEYRSGVGAPLHAAVRHGHENVVKLLLERGADVHLGTEKKDPPILGATDVKVLRLLIQYKADVNAPGEWHTLLTRTINHGELDVAALLLKSGANVNKGAKHGKPLMLAIGYDYSVQAVKLLVKAGVDVNGGNEYGLTPLMKAHRNNQRPVMEILLNAGANINARDMYGYTVLAYDRQKMGTFSNYEELLRTRGAIIPKNVSLGWKLRAAAAKGDLKSVKKYHSQGAILIAPDRDDYAALHYAARGGYNRVIEYLLAKGVAIHGGTRAFRPLYLAIDAKQLKAVRLLVEKGARLERKYGPFDENALERAVTANSPEIIRYFIGKKLDVNRVSSWGGTPIILAVRGGHKAALRVLLENGARMTLHKESGKTLLQEAAEDGHTGIALILLKNGAKVNEKGKIGVTPLILAVMEGHYGMLEALLKKGADPNSKLIWHQNNKIYSALSICKHMGKKGKKMAELLRKHGAR